MSPLLETFGFGSVRGWRGANGSALPAYELISTQLVATAVASVTFSSIPQTYKHLELRWVARTTYPDSFDSSSIIMQINGITSGVYANHNLFATGTTVNSEGSAFTTTCNLGDTTTNFATANAFGSGVVDFLDYANASKNTTLTSFYGYNAQSSRRVGLRSSLYNQTTAVTSLTLREGSEANNLAVGSHLFRYPAWLLANNLPLHHR